MCDDEYYERDYNPYYNPDKCGLELVADVDYSDGCYQFDIRVVWRHLETGRLLTMRDSGCSCPVPFEDYCGDPLEKLDPFNYDEIEAEVRLGGGSSSYPMHNLSVGEGMDFLRKLREADKVK